MGQVYQDAVHNLQPHQACIANSGILLLPSHLPPLPSLPLPSLSLPSSAPHPPYRIEYSRTSYYPPSCTSFSSSIYFINITKGKKFKVKRWKGRGRGRGRGEEVRGERNLFGELASIHNTTTIVVQQHSPLLHISKLQV